MEIEHETFWRTWRGLKARLSGADLPEYLASELSYLLSRVEHFPRTEIRLERAEGQLAATRQAYETTDGRTSQKQAAACRALGLTSTSGRQSDSPDVFLRWLELTRDPETRDHAIETLAEELGGIEPDSAVKRLAAIRDEIQGLLDAHPDSGWADAWRADLEALDNPPAKIPARISG
jgi:hypothetical protein